MLTFDRIRINALVDDFREFAKVLIWCSEEKVEGQVTILSLKGVKDINKHCETLSDEAICIRRESLQALVDDLYNQGIKPTQMKSILTFLEEIAILWRKPQKSFLSFFIKS